MPTPRDGCVIPLPFACYVNLSLSTLSLSPALTIMPYRRTNSLPRKMCLFAYTSVVLAFFFLVHFRTLPLAYEYSFQNNLSYVVSFLIPLGYRVGQTNPIYLSICCVWFGLSSEDGGAIDGAASSVYKRPTHGLCCYQNIYCIYVDNVLCIYVMDTRPGL